MWTVEPPTVTAAESAAACAKGIRDKAVRERVRGAVQVFDANSVMLQGDIHSQALHGADSSRYQVAGLSEDELKSLYKGQLSRQGSKARYVYDHMMANARHDLCSYCQYGVANSLDHFVPITVVPALAIEPWNLVPACDRCNKLLLDSFSSSATHQLLHPYAEPAALPAGMRWLHAHVHHGSEPVVAFHANPDSNVPPDVRVRILQQFEQLQLAALFQVVSARELSGTRARLTELFPGGQAEPVAAHLAELSADALAGDANDRRGVMYEALAADRWFTTAGYEIGLATGRAA